MEAILKTFVLDTNVLLYDPGCLKVFGNNEVIIPLTVLDELDGAKNRFDEVGRNARVAIRMLDELRKTGSLNEGVKIKDSIIKVELDHCEALPLGLSADKADNRIISSAIQLSKNGKQIIVVSKDINLRVKCDALGIEAQDYNKGKVAEQVDSIYSGVETIKVSSDSIDRLYSDGFIKMELPAFPNQFFVLKSEEKESHSAIAKYVKGNLVPLKKVKDIMGITPRNAEQRMAMDLLLDPKIKIVTLIGKAGSGKAQPLDADILTPSGYIKMGDIKINDNVISPDGKMAKISGIFPQGEIDIYKVYFSDGTYTECSEDHLWYTKTQLNRDQHKSGSIKTLKEIMNSLRYGKCNKKNHSIPMVNKIEFHPNKLCKINPYVLGLLLGDGCFRGQTPSFSTVDLQILENINQLLPECQITKKSGDNCDYYLIDKTGRTLKCPICASNETDKFIFYSQKQIKDAGFSSNIYKAIKFNTKYKNYYWSFVEEEKITSTNQLKHFLCDLGLFNKKSNEKFIPEEYKFNSFENRLLILQGLMDTDGSVSHNGITVEFSSTSLQLAKDVKFLVESFGGKAVLTTRQTYYTYKNEKKIGKISYRIFISMPADINPFKLSRKSDLLRPRSKYVPTRYIDRVEYVGKKKAQCIYIEHPDHLYITNNFIVTHNTLLSIGAALYHVLSDSKTFNRVLISRPIQPMGKDLGYLPGSIEEKLNPWMQPIYDNLELILGTEYRRSSMYEGLIQVEPLTYIRGRSIPKSFMLIDESQNLSAQEVKTIITRVGENTKIVFTGDIEQIDVPYFDFADNGLTHVVEKFKEYEISGHITLRKGERSELATLASEIL